MKFTLSWLKEHLDTKATLAEVRDTLTMLGLEVEGITNPAEALKGFVVGYVVEAVQQAWQRLSGTSPEKEETLMTLQQESRALLSLRAEATKLRGGDGV